MVQVMIGHHVVHSGDSEQRPAPPATPEVRKVMRRFRLAQLAIVVSFLVLAPAAALAEVYKIDPNHSQVGFQIRHLVSRVPGRFDKFSGEITYDPANIAASKVTAEIDAATINTANENRDKHLKSPDFFDVEKNPKITFASTSVSAAGKDHFTVAGNLTIHGVTKPATLDVQALGSMANPMGPGQRAGFSAKTTLNRKDFGIVWNKSLDAGGALLGDDVDVTLLVEAVSAAPAAPPTPPKPPAPEAKPSDKPSNP